MATVEQHATEIHNGATNGSSAAAAETEIPVENPATGEIITTVPDLDAAAVADLAKRGRLAQPTWEALRLRGPRARAAADAEVGDGQRRPDRADDRLGDRQDLRGRAAGGDLLRRRGVRLLGQARGGVPGRRAGALEHGVREGQEADPALPPAGAGRRDRPVELPADELLRRLHPRAGGGQRRDPEALGDHPADLAAAGRRPACLRDPRGRLPGGHRPRGDGGGADRGGGHDHVHGLHAHRAQGRGSGWPAADPLLAGAGRQGPDDRARRRRPRARGERGDVLLDAELRPDVHLDRARVRRGAGVRRVRGEGHRQGARAAPGPPRRGPRHGRGRLDDVPAAGGPRRRPRRRTHSRRAPGRSRAGTAARATGTTSSRPCSWTSTTR